MLHVSEHVILAVLCSADLKKIVVSIFKETLIRIQQDLSLDHQSLPGTAGRPWRLARARSNELQKHLRPLLLSSNRPEFLCRCAQAWCTASAARRRSPRLTKGYDQVDRRAAVSVHRLWCRTPGRRRHACRFSSRSPPWPTEGLSGGSSHRRTGR